MATRCCVLILGIRFSAPQAYQKLVLPFTEKTVQRHIYNSMRHCV